MKLNDTLIGLIRTWVPIGVGAVIAWFTAQGLSLDAETQTAVIVALTGVTQAVYYSVVRLLENKIPAVGWLLGSAKTPVYFNNPVAPTTPRGRRGTAKTSTK
jgi:uncharacterized membrane protein (DUF441 family)